jgi:hypothetical protein
MIFCRWAESGPPAAEGDARRDRRTNGRDARAPEPGSGAVAPAAPVAPVVGPAPATPGVGSGAKAE